MSVPEYKPIGDVYQVKFVDASHSLSWNQNVAVPHNAGVEAALRWLEKAFPGRKIIELKFLTTITHGAIDEQRYEKADPFQER